MERLDAEFAFFDIENIQLHREDIFEQIFKLKENKLYLSKAKYWGKALYLVPTFDTR